MSINKSNYNIFYRKQPGMMTELELLSAQKYFHCVNSRMLCQDNSIVIPRYSLWPYAKELELDLSYKNCKLINSYSQHRYVADLREYYQDLSDLTPRTWFRMEDVPDNVGPVILKGETKSRKDKWNKLMYAENKKSAIEVYSELLDDGYLEGQNIYIREYVPLKKLMNDPFGGAPITKEFRFFVFNKKVVASGFYWSNFVEDLDIVPNPTEIPLSFLNKVISVVDDKINFYVIDVAETNSGEFIVVELNDGCSAGLSECKPDELYKNMKKILTIY